jgi:hypothetical protein
MKTGDTRKVLIEQQRPGDFPSTVAHLADFRLRPTCRRVDSRRLRALRNPPRARKVQMLVFLKTGSGIALITPMTIRQIGRT